MLSHTLLLLPLLLLMMFLMSYNQRLIFYSKFHIHFLLPLLHGILASLIPLPLSTASARTRLFKWYSLVICTKGLCALSSISVCILFICNMFTLGYDLCLWEKYLAAMCDDHFLIGAYAPHTPSHTCNWKKNNICLLVITLFYFT